MDSLKLISPNFSDLLLPNIEFKKFPDGDLYIRIIPEINKQEVVLYHRLYPNQNESLIQLFLILKTLKEKECKITLVSPYLPYCRQDKIWETGEAFSSKYICEMISFAGTKKLITFDCHFLKKEGDFDYGNLKIKNISLNKKLMEYAKNNYFKNEKFEIISPDMGSSYMVGENGKSMKKTRGEYNAGKEAYRKIEKMEMNFEVENKNILIIDDMVSGGGTMIRAVENLKENNAKKIVCATTHGFFLKDSMPKLETLCDGVFCSNTIPNKSSKINFMDLI
ncbi:MAG: ribose-phosphate diphosphokinase [Candidatus Micrarchaeia archaeon]